MNKLLNKIIKPSTRSFFTEKVTNPDYSVLTRIHGYIYARWPYFYIGVGTGRHPMARVIKPLWRIFSGTRQHNTNQSSCGKIKFANGYHGKALPVKESRKLIQIDRSINIGDLEQVVPYDRAREIILKNPESIAVLDCPCRATRDNPCLPLDVCLIIGEPFASFILEHHPKKSRKISRDEAISILDREHKQGHVQHAFFKDAMLDRFYAICNCCSCCCGAIQAHKNGVPMLASSGFVAKVDTENCLGCGECASHCQFKAISMEDEHPVINSALCLGCGVCVDQCSNTCLSLRRDPEKCPPLQITELLENTRG